MNAKSAAMQIKDYIDNESLREKMKLKMNERLELFSNYDKHFDAIEEFLVEVGKGL